ncbi:OLC1v1036053C1 [Oldenlandia corymbosa var. corymbosa]|uniref:OLC1v1036053C1 n=1 Tax=Oldenlandia corymbosa var. corymbosa TaxID=529605 RepID=A0AAV1CUI7_OLDCO|nr:OLC1v1036053C1 [Oldenlandia corymbosa var. corymbosa]
MDTVSPPPESSTKATEGSAHTSDTIPCDDLHTPYPIVLAKDGSFEPHDLNSKWEPPPWDLFSMKELYGNILATGSGSGSQVILMHERTRFGIPNAKVGLRPDEHKSGMSVTEAAELAKEAMCYAADCAPQYGDVVTVYYLGNQGCRKLLEEYVEAFWQKVEIKCTRWRFVVIGPGWSTL